MPISINNSLPSIYLYFGTITDDENKMRIRVETGAFMKTGNKDYHQ